LSHFPYNLYMLSSIVPLFWVIFLEIVDNIIDGDPILSPWNTNPTSSSKSTIIFLPQQFTEALCSANQSILKITSKSTISKTFKSPIKILSPISIPQSGYTYFTNTNSSRGVETEIEDLNKVGCLSNLVTKIWGHQQISYIHIK